MKHTSLHSHPFAALLCRMSYTICVLLLSSLSLVLSAQSVNRKHTIRTQGKSRAQTATKKALSTTSSGATGISVATAGAIDLGLSVLWAATNVGANSPEQFGDFFAWGETTPKTNYTWDTYRWCAGASDDLKKYNCESGYGTVDNKAVLDLEDDAAHAKLGGVWRMPTSVEMDELKEKCHWMHMAYRGVQGYKVTGPNGNSIFLPATGYRSETAHGSRGTSGYYWSSTLITSYPEKAFYLFCGASNTAKYNNDRSIGCTVRPVCSPNKTR